MGGTHYFCLLRNFFRSGDRRSILQYNIVGLTLFSCAVASSVFGDEDFGHCNKNDISQRPIKWKLCFVGSILMLTMRVMTVDGFFEERWYVWRLGFEKVQRLWGCSVRWLPHKFRKYSLQPWLTYHVPWWRIELLATSVVAAVTGHHKLTKWLRRVHDNCSLDASFFNISLVSAVYHQQKLKLRDWASREIAYIGHQEKKVWDTFGHFWVKAKFYLYRVQLCHASNMPKYKRHPQLARVYAISNDIWYVPLQNKTHFS